MYFISKHYRAIRFDSVESHNTIYNFAPDCNTNKAVSLALK